MTIRAYGLKLPVSFIVLAAGTFTAMILVDRDNGYHMVLPLQN